jgi:hypothetical protein
LEVIMTAVAATTTPAAGEGVRRVFTGLRTFWTNGRRVERVAYAVGAGLMVSGVLHVLVYAVAGGSWEGPVSWRKPITFGLSFGLTLMSTAWAMSFLRISGRTRVWLLGMFVYACVVEVFGITLQRWRGEASHFNEESTFNAVLGKAGIAAGGGLLVAFVVVLTVLNLRRAPLAGLPAGLRVALRTGWLMLLAAMVFGAIMVVTGVSKLAAPGEDPAAQQAAYTSAGWLKPAHAITMHAILVLPMLAWLTSFLPWTPIRQLRVVTWAAAGYALLAAVVVAETLARVSPLTAPIWANAAAVAGSAVLVGAGVLVLGGLVRGPTQPGLTRL